MQIEEEITRAVKRQSSLDINSRKTEEEIASLIKSITEAVQQNSYDFTKSESIILDPNGRRRLVKRFANEYSSENILCQCIKKIIDKIFKVRYPNRNKSIRSLFDILRAARKMSDFTVIKFDFKDYFNSVSSEYVFEKYLKNKLTDRVFSEIIKDFSTKTKYAYAGFSTSNVISEIIAKNFDEIVKLKLSERGLIYYERYVDDTIVVFNEHIDKDQFKFIINKALEEVFYDEQINVSIKCKTCFNDTKFRYISRRILSTGSKSVDYLGYEFTFCLTNDECKIMYGITAEKRDRYNARIDEIIKYFTDPSSRDYNNMELLRHRISAFTSRCVYRSKKYKSDLWKVKGFISNYGELRFLLDSDLIAAVTKSFLKTMVIKGFNRAHIPIPFFIKGACGNTGYNLFNNMKVNKTLLLIEYIGYDKNSLEKLCKKIGISTVDVKGRKRGYGNLVREYLIKVKVGF